MRISLSDIGKRFNRDWIIRNFSYEFSPEHHYAITGPNGSGKSTLLQVIAGAIMFSEGKIAYALPDGKDYTALESEQAYKHIAIAAPYLELIEEMTLQEFLRFHSRFKPFLPSIGIAEIISITGLGKSADKQIRFYSSGMKQRVKLAQAFFSDTPGLLLDEPCTNLDEEGIALYHRLVDQYGDGRLIIVSSNDGQEYDFCDRTIDIMKYK